MNVQIHYLERPCSDYVRTAVQTASDIHREDAPGDILIFLTGATLPNGSIHNYHVSDIDSKLSLCMSLYM